MTQKAPENLKSHQDPKKDERVRLQAALELNQPLATAYHMKERLRLLFQCVDQDTVAMELKAWIREASCSGIKILKDAARKMMVWKPFILNWHKHPISTGKLEAINGKIGTLQRKSLWLSRLRVSQTENLQPTQFKLCINRMSQKSDVRALVNHDANQVLGRSISGSRGLYENRHGLLFCCDLIPPGSTICLYRRVR